MGADASRRLVLSAALAVVLAWTVACGGGGDDDDGTDGGGNGGAPGSCSVAPASTCIDYTGSTWTATSAEENCKEIPSSSYSTSACPTADRVGSCVHAQGAEGEYTTHYYGPTFTSSTAESACVSSGGVWVG